MRRVPIRQTARLRRDQRGLSSVEYILILILIAVAAVFAWERFGRIAIREKTRRATTQANAQLIGGGVEVTELRN